MFPVFFSSISLQPEIALQIAFKSVLRIQLDLATQHLSKRSAILRHMQHTASGLLHILGTESGVAHCDGGSLTRLAKVLHLSYVTMLTSRDNA